MTRHSAYRHRDRCSVSQVDFDALNSSGAGVEKLLEGAVVRQGNVDGDPGREWTVGADIGLGVENHDDGRTIIEMGIEGPPFIAALSVPMR
jgi:hypothetical protein